MVTLDSYTDGETKNDKKVVVLCLWHSRTEKRRGGSHRLQHLRGLMSANLPIEKALSRRNIRHIVSNPRLAGFGLLRSG